MVLDFVVCLNFLMWKFHKDEVRGIIGLNESYVLNHINTSFNTVMNHKIL